MDQSQGMDVSLDVMSQAPRYNTWMYETIAPWLGARVLEAGAGTGNLTRFLLERERLIAAEYDPAYVGRLRAEFETQEQVRVEQLDLTDIPAVEALGEERLDTVVCLNVLEHLEPDVEVLKAFYRILEPGGHAVILVPQGRWLYGSLDEAVGHVRRYSEADLRERLEAAGFRVEAMLGFNRVAPLGWFVNGRILRRRELPRGQVRAFDRIVGLVRVLDRILPIPALSVIGVGRKEA